MTHSVVLVSGAEQSDSGMHIHMKSESFTRSVVSNSLRPHGL